LTQPVIATRGEKLYLDSCVLVAYFTKHHPSHRKAKDILSKIEEAKFSGIISSLCLMEFMKILREFFVESGQLGSMSAIENELKEFLKVLYSINNIYFVEGRAPEFKPIPDIKSAYFYVIAHNSFTVLSKYCGCVKIDEKQDRRHDGLSPSDAFHVAIAKYLGCDKLVTTDWDFKECQDEVTPLILGDYNCIW